MSTLYKILCIAFCIFSLHSLKGQFLFTEKVSSVQHAILNLNFKQTDSIIKAFSVKEKGMGYWLDAYKSFIYYKTTNRNIFVDSIVNSIKKNTKSIESLKTETAFYYYCLADVNLMLAAIYLEKNELLRAFQYYTQAKTEIVKYRKKFPEFKNGYKHELIEMSFNNMLYKQLGLHNDYSDDDFNRFVQVARKDQDSASVLRREFQLLCFLLKDFQKLDKNSNEPAIFFHDTYAKKGPLESLVSAHELRKTKKYSDLNVVLRNADKIGYNNKLNVLNLWMGDFLLNQSNDSSIMYLNAFLKHQKNNKLVNYARFKASMYYYLKNNYSKSDSIIEIIKNTQESQTDEDKQAIYEAKHSNNWLPELVKARVLFDGGFYNSALNVLLAIKDSVADFTYEQKLEYSYRLGRIYDKKSDLEKASVFYKMVINSNKDSEFYYPAYAACYLGEMFLERGNKEKAFYYFAICKELDSPIYKLSIHKKAEQQLKK